MADASADPGSCFWQRVDGFPWGCCLPHTALRRARHVGAPTTRRRHDCALRGLPSSCRDHSPRGGVLTLRAKRTGRGRSVRFFAFPESPDDPSADGVTGAGMAEVVCIRGQGCGTLRGVGDRDVKILRSPHAHRVPPVVEIQHPRLSLDGRACWRCGTRYPFDARMTHPMQRLKSSDSIVGRASRKQAARPLHCLGTRQVHEGQRGRVVQDHQERFGRLSLRPRVSQQRSSALGRRLPPERQTRSC